MFHFSYTRLSLSTCRLLFSVKNECLVSSFLSKGKCSIRKTRCHYCDSTQLRAHRFDFWYVSFGFMGFCRNVCCSLIQYQNEYLNTSFLSFYLSLKVIVYKLRKKILISTFILFVIFLVCSLSLLFIILTFYIPLFLLFFQR